MLPPCDAYQSCLRLKTAKLHLAAAVWFVCALYLATLTAAAQRTVAEQYLFQALNTSRSAAGLPLLVWSDQLTAAAAQHAERMRLEGSLEHQLDREADLAQRAAVSGVRFSLIAENIGVAPSAAELHDLWFQSRGHRENMLEPEANAVGIALVESNGEYWAVEDFARILADLSLPQQEARVRDLLEQAGVPATTTSAARAMCRTSTGYVGNTPAFVMRYNGTELQRLPSSLLSRLQRGRIGSAAVGACESPSSTFRSYSIAVALYR